MNRELRKLLYSLLLILCSFLIVSCNYNYVSSEDQESFNQDLRGTWVSNDPSIYSGTLIISRNRITISGYYENQTPAQGIDAQRPFKDFTKGIPLLGYSDENLLFIQDAGIWQTAIPFTYWEDSHPTEYRQLRFLRFNFGGRQETLQMQ